jgi:hypothetical protein
VFQTLSTLRRPTMSRTEIRGAESMHLDGRPLLGTSSDGPSAAAGAEDGADHVAPDVNNDFQPQKHPGLWDDLVVDGAVGGVKVICQVWRSSIPFTLYNVVPWLDTAVYKILNLHDLLGRLSHRLDRRSSGISVPQHCSALRRIGVQQQVC